MARVKRGVTARARHKKVLALAKGFRGRRKNVFRIANQAVLKAGLPADVTKVLYKMDFDASARDKDRIVAEWKTKIER